MNTTQLIFNHLISQPSQTQGQIAKAIGRTPVTVKVEINRMLEAGLVWRDECFCFYATEPEGLGDEKFAAARNLAESLENRCLWNRAAAQWHEAQRVTLKTGLREMAMSRANQCVGMARVNDPKPEAWR